MYDDNWGKLDGDGGAECMHRRGNWRVKRLVCHTRSEGEEMPKKKVWGRAGR